MLKKLKKDKSGMMAPIPVVIVILMVSFIALVTIDMNKRTVLADEIKGMADVAAAGALAYAVDVGKAYSSNFQVNQSVAKNKFNQLFEEAINPLLENRGIAQNFQVKRVTVKRLKSSYKNSDGSDDDRDQYVLEAIVSVGFRQTTLIEHAGQQMLQYRDPERGALITLTDSQTESEGKTFVRGSARVILR